MSKNDFGNRWKLAHNRPLNRVANSLQQEVVCAACERGLAPPGIQVVYATLFDRRTAELADAWICFSCAQSVFHAPPTRMLLLRNRYRAEYNENNFGHLRSEIERRRAPWPPIVARFLYLMSADPPREIPRNVLLGVNDYLKKLRPVY